MLRLVEELSIISASGHTSKFENRGMTGLYVRLRATKTSTAIVDTDMAAMRLRLTYKGEDVVNAAWATLEALSNTVCGANEKTEGGSGVESSFGFFIPFGKPGTGGKPGIQNAIHKADNEGFDFYVDKCAVSGCSTATVEVYADIDDTVPHLFTPHFVEYASTAAAGNVKTDLVVPNIAAILITAPSTVPDNVALYRDGALMDSGTWGILRLKANITGALETALTSVFIDMVASGRIDESLSDKASVLTSGGSGAHYIAAWYLTFDYAKTQYTRQVGQAVISNKLRIKGADSAAAKVAVTAAMPSMAVNAAAL